MPKQNNTLSRRDFLKGAAYTSALSMGGLSSMAIANSVDPVPYIENGMITLINQNNQAIALDAKRPISLEEKNGWIVVNVNKAPNANSAQALNLESGQKLSFAVENGVTPTLTSRDQHHGINSTIFVGEDNFPASLYHAAFA